MIFKGQVRYRTETERLGDGAQITRKHGTEKGVDVRIAIDLIRLAHRRQYDVAIVFSQTGLRATLASSGQGFRSE